MWLFQAYDFKKFRDRITTEIATAIAGATPPVQMALVAGFAGTAVAASTVAATAFNLGTGIKCVIPRGFIMRIYVATMSLRNNQAAGETVTVNFSLDGVDITSNLGALQVDDTTKAARALASPSPYVIVSGGASRELTCTLVASTLGAGMTFVEVFGVLVPS